MDMDFTVMWISVKSLIHIWHNVGGLHHFQSVTDIGLSAPACDNSPMLLCCVCVCQLLCLVIPVLTSGLARSRGSLIDL
jgi:hypothetical protein